MADRVTSSELEQRINRVVTMLLDGLSVSDIVRFSAENWKLKRRQTEKYIQRANEEISKRARIDRDRGIDWHIEARKNLLKKAVIKQDDRLVKDILRDLGEMQGMYPKRQLEVETKNIPVSRDEILNELAKYATRAGLTLDEYCHREGINQDDIQDASSN